VVRLDGSIVIFTSLLSDSQITAAKPKCTGANDVGRLSVCTDPDRGAHQYLAQREHSLLMSLAQIT
jgi:hypothetical protein